MLKKLTFLAALAAASACTAAAQTEAPVSAAYYDAPAAECRIDIERSGGLVRFDALARANDTIDGAYELTLTKEDRDGVSYIVQAGEVYLVAGEMTVLGTSELNVARSGDFSATLVVTEDGIEVCRDERRS